jgi:mono/diheme cytochrome c family protein
MIVLVFLLFLAGIAVDSNGETRAGDVAHKPSGDNARGEELYKASCVVCHGPSGGGGIGPRLAGNPVLSNDQAFWKVVYEGRHVMPPLKGVVSEQQMADIRAWLKTLR